MHVMDWTHLVSQRKLVFFQPHASAKALGDTETIVGKFSGELEANAIQVRVAL